MNVLIIAPYFAPNPEVAAVRIVSLSKQMVQAGHDVTVLCLSRRGLLRENSNEELTGCVPDGVKTIRFYFDYCLTPLIADYINGKRFKKILFTIIDPSDYDVVLTSCGPFYTLEAMPFFSKRGVPYVLDFRDLGALNYRPQIVRSSDRSSNPIKEFIKKLFNRFVIVARERRAVDCANRINCISEIDRDTMKSAYAISDSKLSVVKNGFDAARLESVRAIPATYYAVSAAVFGKFMYYDKKRALMILEALCDLRSRGMDVGLMHIGKQYPWISKTIADKKLDASCYKNLGLMEYGKGMGVLGGADFYVVEDTSLDNVGTKIYDYIYWNKPVVAVVAPDGPLAKLVHHFENGFVCTTKDDAREAIETIVSERLSLLDAHLDIYQYSREHQNAAIQRMLESVSTRGKIDYTIAVDQKEAKR